MQEHLTVWSNWYLANIGIGPTIVVAIVVWVVTDIVRWCRIPYVSKQVDVRKTGVTVVFAEEFQPHETKRFEFVGQPRQWDGKLQYIDSAKSAAERFVKGTNPIELDDDVWIPRSQVVAYLTEPDTAHYVEVKVKDNR